MPSFIWTPDGPNSVSFVPPTRTKDSITITFDLGALKQKFPGEEFSFKWSVVENPNSKFVISLKSYPAKYPLQKVFSAIPKDFNTHDLILFVNSVLDPGNIPAPWKVVIEVFRKMAGKDNYELIEKGSYNGEARRAGTMQPPQGPQGVPNRRREPYMELKPTGTELYNYPATSSENGVVTLQRTTPPFLPGKVSSPTQMRQNLRRAYVSKSRIREAPANQPVIATARLQTQMTRANLNLRPPSKRIDPYAETTTWKWVNGVLKRVPWRPTGLPTINKK